MCNSETHPTKRHEYFDKIIFQSHYRNVWVPKTLSTCVYYHTRLSQRCYAALDSLKPMMLSTCHLRVNTCHNVSTSDYKRRHVDQPKLTHVQNIPTTVTTCVSINKTHHTKNYSILTTDYAYRSFQSFDLVLSAHLISTQTQYL